MQSFKKLLGPIFGLAFVAILATAYLNRWAIYDFARLRSYSPPAAVVKLADETTMNSSTRRLFYVNHPKLENKAAFSEYCGAGEATIVLGCFVPRKGIFIDNIDDPRLSGVLQVTAAHETLHAAYERLAGNDKKEVDSLLNRAFASLDNQRIKDTIEQYKKNGADITNELHAILGTEVRSLPPELENYYKRYFDNRLAIVGFSENYESAFTSRKQQVAAYDKQLDELKGQIETQQAALEAHENQINAEKVRLDNLLSERRYKEYNDGVPGFNGLVASYNAKVGSLRELINQYNSILKARNEIALEQNELYKVIDNNSQQINTR